MSVKIYDIDYRKLVRWMTPHALRQAAMLSWVYGITSAVVTVYQLFLRYRTAKLYQLSITPQVCYLEKMLNDRFDNTERRIYIDDGITYDPPYLYLDSEEKPIWLYTSGEPVLFIYTDGETVGTSSDDFVVYVPGVLSFNNDEMKALLNAYKLAGKRYKIQLI